MCDVTLPLTPLLYVTRRHNNVNPPPPSERDEGRRQLRYLGAFTLKQVFHY